MERKVIICDVCEKSFAIGKCIFCDRDICERCGGSIDEWEDLAQKDKWAMFLSKKDKFCEKCLDCGIVLGKVKGYEEMKQEIIKKVRDKIILKGLKK